MQSGLPFTRLIHRLEASTVLSEGDIRLINALPVTVRNYDGGHIIAMDGNELRCCCLVMSGLIHRQKSVGESGRQIMSFHIAGDIPDMSSLHLGKADHDLATAGPAVVALIPHHEILKMLEVSARLTHAFWRETLVEAAMFREWVINIGRRHAIARVAHVFCEMATRLRVVGLANGNAFKIPWTQLDIADACAITPVHTNRVLQELRATGVIEWQHGNLKILRWADLVRIADFSPDYLHINEEDGGDGKSSSFQGGAA